MKKLSLDSMKLKEAIDVRRSRRKYLTTPIDNAIKEKLNSLAQEYSLKGNIRIEFVWDDGSAFNGLRKSYGMFSGVQNYAGLIADKNDFEAIERLGYYGELLMLQAVSMGLGTCWVGGSFDRKLCPFTLSDDEMIICTIVVGNALEKDGLRERFIHSLTHRKTKTIEEMIVIDKSAPDWFMKGMQAVQQAPSSMNQQPVQFSLKNDQVTASIDDMSNVGSVLDLGIAKLHFELGASCGTWGFGNNAAFNIAK